MVALAPVPTSQRGYQLVLYFIGHSARTPQASIHPAHGQPPGDQVYRMSLGEPPLHGPLYVPHIPGSPHRSLSSSLPLGVERHEAHLHTTKPSVLCPSQPVSGILQGD